ncbi:hypothetical protein M0802_010762 [Mischocyttarus mexicanus]|nr:hypothetical protein M0802_010762 [Mischocyttarus mexicanus]
MFGVQCRMTFQKPELLIILGLVLLAKEKNITESDENESDSDNENNSNGANNKDNFVQNPADLHVKAEQQR